MPLAPAPALPALRRDLFLVDLDAFYAEVERLRDPALAGRPLIVGGLPGDRGVVACASYEARALGVRAGMPLFEAAALCPRGTVFLRGDHALYREASRRVLDVLGRFTPRVEPVSLDEAWLDLTGCEHLHRSCLDAAAKIHRAVREETGLAVSIGIGGTRAVAAIAVALAKPSGVLEVRRGEEAAFLEALPLEHLPGVGPRLRRDLARFNLHTVGDLAAVPEEVLVETFGARGAALSRRARGFDPDPPVGTRVPRSRTISRETSFARDTADPVEVDATVSYLAQRATRALRAEGLLVRSLGVRLRYADFHTVEIRRRFARPTDRDAEVLHLARGLWRRRYGEEARPGARRRVALRLVGVVLHDLVPGGPRQLDLFETSAALPSPRAGLAERLDRAVDLVRERHGFGALVRGRAIDLVGRLPRTASGFRLHTPACSR